MSTSRRLVSRAVVLGMVALLLTPTTIWADNLDLDGDGLAPVAGSDMAFGSVCLGETVAKAVIFQIHKTGGTHFANGASVAIAPASASAGLSAGGASITLPANWNLLPNGTTRSATTTSTVELTPSTVGPFSGSISYSATAPQAGSGTHSDAAALDVTADVVSCDTTPPSLNLPGDITAEATGPTGAVVTYAASATDANPTNPVVTCSPASGSTFPLGATAVNCSATDAANNTASGTFSVIVVDTTAPSVGTPSIAAVEATGPAGATVTYTLPAATDIVDGSVAVACSPASGSAFPLGSTAVTCSATDSAGNTGSSAFNIVVEDTTAPTLLVPADITAEATGPGGAAVTYSATALDIVDGAVTPDCSTASGSTFPLGTTNVSCTATDNAGNSTSADFDVTVVDTTPPDISVPPDITVEATGPAGAAVTYTASASDIVDGSLAVDCSPASGSTFALGTTLVTCSATDNAGNIGSNSFDVTVVDTTPPALTTPSNVVTGPTSVTGAVVAFGAATAVDIVDGSLSATCVPPSGSAFGFGITTVTCSATDAAGNTGMGSFTVTVNGFTFGGFYQPVDMTMVNTVKGGSTVPVKWELFGASGVEFTSTAAVSAGWPKTQKIDCGSLASLYEDAIETTSSGGTSLRYDATAGQFIYNWQTPKQPNTCWRLDVKFADGTTKSASFKLK